MVLILGKGTVIGATAGLVLTAVLLVAIWVQWERELRILKSPNTTRLEKRASMNFAFWLQGFQDACNTDPVSFTWRIMGIPVTVGALAGFGIENLARLF